MEQDAPPPFSPICRTKADYLVYDPEDVVCDLETAYSRVGVVSFFTDREGIVMAYRARSLTRMERAAIDDFSQGFAGDGMIGAEKA